MVTEKRKRRRGKSSDDGPRINGNAAESTPGSSGYKPQRTLLINPEEESSQLWYDWGNSVPGRNDSIAEIDAPSKRSERYLLAQKFRSHADEILRVELSLRASNAVKAGSDERWVENTMKKGTLKDRIAATSVLVSTDPIHKLSALDSLLTMAGCSESGQSNSRVAQMAAEALEDLFLNTLLPPGRKLLTLEHRPLDSYEPPSKKTLSPRVLLLWRFEEILKNKYQSFLTGYLVATLRDGMDLNKTFALRTAGSMLRSTPEGEAQLLTMMVNKLGDPGRKIAASASHELRRVLDDHENMQEIVAREVQQLAHRPHLSQKGLYSCIVFLNQLKLRKETRDPVPGEVSRSLAVSLVNTYFRMFDVAMKKQSDDKSGMKSRLLSALLTGINRAHPFLPDKDQGLEDHMDSLYNVSHVAAPSASTQALMLLFHVALGPIEGTTMNDTQKVKQDRFYRAVYAKLSVSSALGGGKHLTMFFNLVYKTMKYDQDPSRVLAFAKRLMCTVVHLSPAVVAGALFLLNEVMKTHKHLVISLNDVPDEESANLVLDPSKREPRAAMVHVGGKETDDSDQIPPLWDVCLLSCHFHPSVSKFAGSLGGIEYAGDPLRDFALGPFLDKFSYKNPKGRKKEKLSIAQRKVESQVVKPVNDPSFLRKQNVDEADTFFHKFFVERARRKEDKDATIEREDEDVPDEEVYDLLDDHQMNHLFDDGASTDSDERMFVDKLAIGLMDEEVGESDGDLDDEDPADIDDWEDIKDDIDLESDVSDPIIDPDSGDDEINSNDDASADADLDNFMDDSDSDDQDDILLSDDDEDEVTDQGPLKTKHRVEADVFADADEYADILNKVYVGGGKQLAKNSEVGNRSKAKRQKS